MADDVGNQPSTATALSLSAGLPAAFRRGLIGVDGDVDFFSFEVEAGAVVEISLYLVAGYLIKVPNRYQWWNRANLYPEVLVHDVNGDVLLQYGGDGLGPWRPVSGALAPLFQAQRTVGVGHPVDSTACVWTGFR